MTGTGLYFHGDSHAGTKVHKSFVHPHPRLVERSARGIDQFLSSGLATIAFITGAMLFFWFPLRLIPDSRA